VSHTASESIPGSSGGLVSRHPVGDRRAVNGCDYLSLKVVRSCPHWHVGIGEERNGLLVRRRKMPTPDHELLYVSNRVVIVVQASGVVILDCGRADFQNTVFGQAVFRIAPTRGGTCLR